MSTARKHFWTDAALGKGGGVCPRKYGMNWFIPAFVSSSPDSGGGIRDATARLVCYKIREAAAQTPLVPRDVAVANELGSATLTAVKASTLCVPAEQQ